MPIDITFDFRTDVTGGNPDPDASSPTLLHYHHLLWSKPLPSGRMFGLTPHRRVPFYLEHDSDLGYFALTSDAGLPTFIRRTSMQPIFSQLPPDYPDRIETVVYTIGGMIMWPGVQVDRKWTVNQARGCSHQIVDRLDLTVECVRRHYSGDDAHPLGDVFNRCQSFFGLFDNFAGYVDFWLLDDLIGPDGELQLFLPSDDFTLPSLPQTVADYMAFWERTAEFVAARNQHIQQLWL